MGCRGSCGKRYGGCGGRCKEVCWGVGMSKERCVGSRVLQAPRPSPISLNHFLVLQFDHLTMNMKFRGISLMFTSATKAILRPTF